MEWLREHLTTVLFKLSDTEVTPLSLLIFLAMLGVTVVVARIVRGMMTRILSRKSQAQQGLAYAVGRITQYLVLILGTLLALDNVGLDIGALTAVGAVLTVGIGFGLQNITQNFISGIILLIERPVQKGDFIEVGDIVGTVTDIEMRATRVISRDGVAVIVPNSQLITGTVVNQTQPFTRKRSRIAVGVAYGTDTDKVRTALIEVALADERVLRDPAPLVFLKSFGESALDFELAVWLEHPEAELRVASDIRFAIDKAFRERGIVIPFPQREVRVTGGSLSGAS